MQWPSRARGCGKCSVSRSLLLLDSFGGGSDSFAAGFAGTDADHLVQLGDEDLAITDLAGAGDVDDGFDDLFGDVIGNRQLEFGLGQKVDDVLGTPVQLGMPALPAVALDLGDRNAVYAHVDDGLADIVELERLDDRLNFFHVFSLRNAKRLGRLRSVLPDNIALLSSQRFWRHG